MNGKVALVAGATRGAGRAIAVELGAAGATVVCTGRSVAGAPSDLGRPETLEGTVERVRAAGGTATLERVDHTVEAEVAALAERLRATYGGLDVLVDDVWGGDPLTEWGRAFWELDLERVRRLLERGLVAHLVTVRHLTPLLLARGGGLLVEVTDGKDDLYRQNLAYDLVKSGVNRLALGMDEELRPHGVTVVAVSPGFLRSEAMLDHFGVTEATWRQGMAQDPAFAGSETPHFVARGIAALAADPAAHELAGRVVGSWDLGRRYGIRDVDGRRPDWGAFYDAVVVGGADPEPWSR